MHQTATRSSPSESKADRASPPAEALSITLGFDRMAFPRQSIVGRSSFRAVLDFLTSPNGRPVDTQQPLVRSPSEPALLLTEADFAPLDDVLPMILRIAALIVIAIALGGAAQLAVG